MTKPSNRKGDDVALTTRNHRIATLLLLTGALLILAATAQAATSQPLGTNNTASRALLLRSEALNQRYHLGSYSPAPKATAALPAYQALMLRSEALNEHYHLGSFAPATRAGTSDFSWSAFGIGAGAMLGLVLLSGGAIIVGRQAIRMPRTRISS